MGLTRSGGLADVAFVSIAADRIGTACLGIIAYFGFRDGIFVISQTPEASARAFQVFSKSAQPHWILECDSESSCGVARLDRYVYKGPTFHEGMEVTGDSTMPRLSNNGSPRATLAEVGSSELDP